MSLCRDSRQRRIDQIRSIPVFRGSEPGDDDDQNTDPNKPKDDGTGGAPSGDGGDPAPPRVYTQTDIDEILKRMTGSDRARVEAEKKAAEAEKRAKEYEDRDKSELEKATNRAKELEAEAAAAKESLQKALVSNKFLASNKYTWHDAETALALLDRAEIKIDDDGKVTGVEEAIEALAKAKPFLVNSDSKKSSDKNNSGGKPSGGQPPANSGHSDKEKQRKELEKKYPQLTMGR